MDCGSDEAKRRGASSETDENWLGEMDHSVSWQRVSNSQASQTDDAS
jgi:hypothetical protein